MPSHSWYRSRIGVALVALAAAMLAVWPASAQSGMAQRLEADRLGAVEPGAYEAGDNTLFTIDRDGGHYLLRFTGQPEVFVLYAFHGSMGGRILKYDSGRTALQITGWGGMTLYTDVQPGGVPVVRTGDSAPPALPDVTVDVLRAAAAADAQQLAAAHRLSLNFELQWDRLAGDPALRAEGLDALGNAARGIGRFASIPAGQRALAGQIQTVFVAGTGKPTLERKNRQLIITFDPSQGFAGRASSRAIARALHTVFKVPGD